VRAKLAVKAEAQIFLFQKKTFNPSSIPMGIRLKSAIQALTAAPSRRIGVKSYWGIGNAIAKNIVDNTMFVAGPAMDIFPMLSLSANPAIITAPGDMILKNGENMENSVRMAPMNVSLNSAHNSFLCAAILWAISCVKKDAVKIAVNRANINDPPILGKAPRVIPQDNPMPITSSVAIVKCWISLVLKFIFRLFVWIGR